MLTKGFWLGKTFVTVNQWKKIMGLDLRAQLVCRINDNTLYDLGGKSQTLRDFMRWSREADPALYMANAGDDLPMYFVSWNDAMDFCRRLTAIERAAGRLPREYEYSLPTEAQWEYACRAGTVTAIYAGSSTPDTLNKIAWYEKNSAEGYRGRRLGPTHSGPHEVGQKEPNAWGLYDMYGNIWQWCRDWYGPYPDEDTTDPAGPKSGTSRVNRGGSFGSGPNSLRSAARAANPPPEASAYRGLRVALSFSKSH
jgi:formylglycine-generating enzyme required for sulfatase activity